jgi:lipopolysaccharide export system permease protein
MVALKTIGFYIGKRFLVSIISVFLLCLLLIFFIDFIEVLRDGAKRDDVSAFALAAITLLRIPTFAELALPFAVLIGSIAAFLSLSRTSELVIIRASGLSVWQFLQPAIAVALMLGVFSVTVYNPLAASLRAESERMQAELFGSKKALGTRRDTGSWLRQDGVDGPTVVHAQTVAERGLLLAGVTVLQFDLNKKFLERIQAQKAELRQGYWLLENATVYSPGEASRFFDTYHVSTFFGPTQVMDSIGSVETLSFWQLPAFIEFARKAGLDTARYELQYQLQLARPVLLIAMVLIAATCSLKAFRFGKIQTMVLTGLAGGFGFFIFSELSRRIGSSGLVSVALAAWAPAVIACLLAMTVLLHQEDG